MRRSTLLVLLLAALTFIAGLGRGAIADSDEAFYAESAREMVTSGDWLTPHFNDQPRFQKPILYYWLTAATYRVFGASELPARLWSALAGVGIVLVTLACGRRWFDEETACLAAAMTATSFGYFAIARMALPDLPLAFFVTLAIWCTFVATLEHPDEPGHWLVGAAVASALGFLMKGPLAVLLAALVVLPVVVAERRTLTLRAVDIVRSFLAFAIVAAPWFAVMWWMHGPGYLEGFFVGDNYERFATTRFNDPRPWWFYLPVIAGGLLPWSPLALVWLTPIRRFLTSDRRIDAVTVRLLAWVLLPLAFFTLSIGKQPRYILPMLPPLALLLARSLTARTPSTGSDAVARRHPAVVVGTTIAGLLLIGLAALLYRAQPLFIGIQSSTTWMVAGAITVMGGAVMAASLSRAWTMAPLTLAIASAVTFAVLPFGTLPSPRDAAVRQIAEIVRDVRTEGEAIGTFKVFVRNLVFYTHTPHTDLVHDQHLTDWLASHPRALIVMPAADASRLQREHGMALTVLATRPYFNDAGVRVRTLLWPDKKRDLETVAVVRAIRSH